MKKQVLKALFSECIPVKEDMSLKLLVLSSSKCIFVNLGLLLCSVLAFDKCH